MKKRLRPECFLIIECDEGTIYKDPKGILTITVEVISFEEERSNLSSEEMF